MSVHSRLNCLLTFCHDRDVDVTMSKKAETVKVVWSHALVQLAIIVLRKMTLHCTPSSLFTSTWYLKQPVKILRRG